MEDLIREESYLQLAAALGANPSTEVLPAHSGEVPVLPPGEAEGAEPLRRTVRARPAHRLHLSTRPEEGSNHHTLLPRMMVTTAMLATLGSPIVLALLHRQGHFDLDGTDYVVDQRGRTVITAAVVAIVVCYNLGWWWWTMAASMNARKRARYTLSPWFSTVVMVINVASIWLLPRAIDQQRDATETYSATFYWCVGLVAVPLLAHFAMLGAFRRAARAISATQRPWTFATMVPFVMLGVNGLARFFTQLVGDSFFALTGIVNLVFVGAYVLALYQGMASFDRACIGRQMAHSERADLSEFIARIR